MDSNLVHPAGDRTALKERMVPECSQGGEPGLSRFSIPLANLNDAVGQLENGCINKFIVKMMNTVCDRVVDLGYSTLLELYARYASGRRAKTITPEVSLSNL
jgi:hypothetical protein